MNNTSAFTPTSEVGLPSSGTSANEWRAVLEAQNKTLMKIVEQLAQNRANNESRGVILPVFNAESPNADVVAWCSTVDLIMAERKLEGGALIIALSKCMQGSASQWLSQISFPGIKWEIFKELIIQRYGGVESLTATVSNIFNNRPAGSECLSVSGSMVTALMTKLQNIGVEELAVSIVLAHVVQQNNGLQHLLFTKDIKTRSDLQKCLKSTAKARE